MAINSKAKGDKFERKIAKLLSQRFNSFLNKEEAFIRNMGSGARFGGKNQNRARGIMDDKLDVGDIVVPTNFKFNIECKHYKESPKFKSIVESNIAMWNNWIEQATQDRLTSNKHAFIIVIKYNLVKEIVILDSILMEEFKDNILVIYKNTYPVILLEDFLLKEDKWYFK